MGNNHAKDDQTTQRIKAQTLRANFERFTCPAQSYDPLITNFRYEIVTLVLRDGYLNSYINERLEFSIPMNHNQQITAEDAYLNEIILGLQINGCPFI